MQPTGRALALRITVVLVTAAALSGTLPSGLADEADGTLTGQILNRRGVPLSDAVVTMGERVDSAMDDGRFLLTSVTAGTVSVERVGYAPQVFEWDGSSDWMTVTMAPRVVRAIHVAGWVAGDDAGWADMMSIAASTGINTLMIDLKNENGRVYFDDLGVATIADLGALSQPSTSLRERVGDAQAADLYTIARIVTFQDPIVANLRPGWAVIDTTTGQPMERNGQNFLDPHNPDAQQYAIDLALAACAAGIDEIQFDYVRFPDGDKSNLQFGGPADAQGRQDTITAFLSGARQALVANGCATAADIFGFITNKTHEGGIGQQLEAVASAVDVVSPMVYPSLYSIGWYGFTVPKDHPGIVVSSATNDAIARLGGSEAIVRPWLQDFSYSSAQVREQIEAIDGLGRGWMLWNIASEFTTSAIPSAADMAADETVPAPVFLTLPPSGFFDVAGNHPFSDPVAWLSGNGITTGCNPPWADWYCPGDDVSRGQMAAFLTRALDLEAPPGVNSFDDDDGSPFETDIEALLSAGITLGCGERSFCPSEPLSRAQMASLLARALELAPSANQPFSDVRNSIHADNIAALAQAKITLGCSRGPTNFCPSDPVSRGQMAAFLYRGLTPIG